MINRIRKFERRMILCLLIISLIFSPSRCPGKLKFSYNCSASLLIVLQIGSYFGSFKKIFNAALVPVNGKKDNNNGYRDHNQDNREQMSIFFRGVSFYAVSFQMIVNKPSENVEYSERNKDECDPIYYQVCHMIFIVRINNVLKKGILALFRKIDPQVFIPRFCNFSSSGSSDDESEFQEVWLIYIFNRVLVFGNAGGQS